MRLRIGSVALAMLAFSALLPVGCSSANEENLGGQTSKVVPHKEGTPDFKSYGEAMQYQADQLAKNRPAKGKAGAKSKPAPPPEPSQPEAGKEQPKTP